MRRALIVVLVSACANDRPGTIAATRQAIFSGSDGLVSPDNTAHPNVFTINPPSALCSASLVASDVVLTAGHCTNANIQPTATYSPLNGTYGINITFNTTPTQTAKLAPILPLNTTSFAKHPLFTENDATSADLALLFLPVPVCRKAMKPIQVASASLVPDPPVDPNLTGLDAWAGMFINVLGGGLTTSNCQFNMTAPGAPNIDDLTSDVLSVQPGNIAPFGPMFSWSASFAPGASHNCPGDSGGPVLSGTQSIFGTNIPAGLQVSLVSFFAAIAQNPDLALELGPALQDPNIRDWLVANALDRDGDQIEAFEDNCDTVPNGNQKDSNHDGVGDACNDADGDCVPDAQDNCIMTKNAPGASSSCTFPIPNLNGGQVTQPCANAAGQLDSDCDGTGDPCDPCPCDPSNDSDGDGICGLEDLCPKAYSYNYNGNVLSEQAHDKKALGDECEPVPAPTEPDYSNPFADPSKKIPCPDQCQICCPNCVDNGFPCCPDQCPPGDHPGVHIFMFCGSLVGHAFAVRALAGRGQNNPAVVFNDLNVQTPARFCPRRPGITCDELNFDIQDARLLDAPTLAAETANTHFLRVAFLDPSEGNGTQPDGPTATFDYTLLAEDLTASAVWNWDYVSDNTRWINAGYPISQPLVGNFWLHSASTVNSATRGAQLSNHHDLGADGVGLQPVQGTCFACGEIKIPQPIGNAAPAGTGASAAAQRGFPVPRMNYLAWRASPATPDQFRRFDAEKDEASVVLAMGGGMYGALNGGCGGDVVNGRVGPHLQATLADQSLVWANAAEPLTAQGAGPQFPLAVALSNDGGSVVDTAVTDGRTMQGDDDRRRTNQIDQAPPLGESPDVIDFVPVLSRMRHGVFVVGGQEPRTRAPSGQIWFQSLDDRRLWSLVPTPGWAPEVVLAATYDFRNDALYVLDQTAAGEARLTEVRLGETPPADVLVTCCTASCGPDCRGQLPSSTVNVLATWTRHPEWDGAWLATDLHGKLLLATSNSLAAQHAVARLDVAGRSLRVDGVQTGNHPLLLPPISDPSGTTLVLVHPDRTVKRHREHKLRLEPATLKKIGRHL